MRRILYIALSLLLLSLAGCTQQNIYTEVDYNVTLDPSNTYYAGDPVVFNISGNPDYVIFYSGEDGHRYEYRNRYEAPSEDVRSMTLDLQIQHRWGNAQPALDIYFTNDFAGLAGNDGAADRALVKSMLDGGMQGWTKVDYKDSGAKQNVYVPVSADVSDCITNLCIAFHWHPDEGADPDRMDSYYVNGTLTVDIEGVSDPVVYDLSTLVGTAVMMDESLDAYHINSGNGSIRLDTDQDITFAGGNYSNIGHRCEGWLFSTPRAFNVTSPDESIVVKNIQNYAGPFEYTYSEPGTYQAVFVGRNADYLGSSEEVIELQVTVLSDIGRE